MSVWCKNGDHVIFDYIPKTIKTVIICNINQNLKKKSMRNPEYSYYVDLDFRTSTSNKRINACKNEWFIIPIVYKIEFIKINYKYLSNSFINGRQKCWGHSLFYLCYLLRCKHKSYQYLKTKNVCALIKSRIQICFNTKFRLFKLIYARIECNLKLNYIFLF